MPDTETTPPAASDPGDMPPAAASEPDAEARTSEVTHLVESAAELGLGAVIGPFTGGETVDIVGSVASMLDAGVDRLTHLGERGSRAEPKAETPRDDDGTEPSEADDRAAPDDGRT